MVESIAACYSVTCPDLARIFDTLLKVVLCFAGLGASSKSEPGTLELSMFKPCITTCPAAHVIGNVTRGNSSRSYFFLLLLVLGFAVVPRVQATTIQEMSFAEVVAGAELVFEGKVLRMETRMQDGGIRTYVTFEVLDVIKGDYPGAELTLHYLGGQVGTRRLQVAELQLPQSGEVGVYFVESLQENLVHPLVGWAQGHFLVDSGYVTSASHQPLQEVDAQPQVIDPNSFSKGVAKGVKVQEFHLLQDAMTIENFKAIIRDVSVAQGAQ